MNWTTVIYLYKETTMEGQELHCMNCRRLIGIMNHNILAILPNNKGIAFKDLPPGTSVFEHKCRGCPAVYKIYFQ